MSESHEASLQRPACLSSILAMTEKLVLFRHELILNPHLALEFHYVNGGVRAR